MSVVFVVETEDQLAAGVAWCERMAAVTEGSVHVAVVGPERKTLAENARRRISEHPGMAGKTLHVELVESNPDAVAAFASSVRCNAMLIVHQSNTADFQQKLFEQSMELTLWVNAMGGPPESPNQVFAMLRRPSLVTTIASEKLLAITPAATLCDNVNLDKDGLLQQVRSAMDAHTLGADNLVLCGVDEMAATDPVYQTGLAMLEQPGDATIALVHSGKSLAETVALTIHRWVASVAPPMKRDQRIELANNLRTGSKPNLEFLGLISASSMLAAFGLLQDSAAVIIGAMLIAPLMTPIVGAGLALSHGNRPLFQSALWTIALGFVGAITASVLFGWLFMLFQEPQVSGEMWARCRPSPLDFCVGLVGGMAASYAQTRSHLSSALAGAAIAAALVPPLATAGLQIAFGVWQESDQGVPVIGPLLLVCVNVLMIMIGSSFVLWARGMRSDRSLGMKTKWTLRMFAVLVMLALMTLIWILHPFPTSWP